MLKDSSNKIIFNAETFEIKQRENGLVYVNVRDTVSGKQTLFRARKCVSAVPINLLSKISFEPELPLYKQNVLRSCRMGNYGKVLITYKDTWWRSKGFSGEVMSDGTRVILKNQKSSNGKNFPTRGPISCIFDATLYDNSAALVAFLTADALVQWFGKNSNKYTKKSSISFFKT